MSVVVELSQESAGVRKRILSLLKGVGVPKTLTALQISPVHISLMADGEGQLCRVGPFELTTERTRVYDWWIAEIVTLAETTWRRLDEVDSGALSEIYATVASVAAKAPLTSPTFAGTPAAPTPSTSDDSERIATTAFVRALLASSGAPLIFPSATPPTDTSVLWLDTTDNTLSAWNGSVWVVVSGYLPIPAAPASLLDQLLYGTAPLLYGDQPLTYTT